MTTVVIEAPEPIVTSADLPATRLAGPALDAIIAAAQEGIDGPTGWVGRCFGVQLLETVMEADPSRWLLLPYPPVIEVISVHVLGGEAVSFDVSDDAERRVRINHRGRAVVQFRAGYSEDEGTGKVPERARQAVIIAASHLANLDMSELSVRTEDVEGVGSTTYSVSNAALEMVEAVTRNLLRGLRVIRP